MVKSMKLLKHTSTDLQSFPRHDDYSSLELLVYTFNRFLARQKIHGFEYFDARARLLFCVPSDI
jgi:hypothetical protein